MQRLALGLITGSLLLLASVPAIAQSYTVRGSVVDPSEVPIAGATVHVRRMTTNVEFAALMELKAAGKSGASVTSTRTAQDGSYAIEVPEPGLWYLEYGAQGMASISHTLGPSDSHQDLGPIMMPEAHRLDLKLADDDGRPVAGALVRVASYRNRSNPLYGPPVSVAARSNARGVATLWVAQDRAQVDIAAPGFVPGANRNVPWEMLAEGDWNSITLLRAPERRVRLTLDGKPLPEAVLLIEGGRLALARTNRDGEALVAVPKMATKDNPMPMVVEAEVAGDVIHHHFGLLHRPPKNGSKVGEVPIKRRWVEGKVVDGSDRGVEGVFVWSTAPRSAMARTVQDGGYRFAVSDQVPSRSHDLTVRVADAGINLIHTEFGEHQRIIVQPARGLRITTLDEDREPIPGVSLSVVEELTQMNRHRRRTALLASTGLDGSGLLGPMTAETTYRLEVYRPGYRRHQRLLAPRGEAQTSLETLEVVLVPGATQVGWVTDENDQPIPGAMLEVMPGIGNGASQMRQELGLGSEPLAVTTTDGEGRFEVRDLEPVKVRLAVSAVGFAPTAISGIELPETDSEIGTISLSKGLVLSGHVIDENGEGVADLQLVLTGNASRFSRGYDEDQLTGSDSEGAFRYENLADGSYSLHVEAPEYESEWEPVELDQDRSVEVQVRRTFSLKVKVVDSKGELANRPRITDRTGGGSSSHSMRSGEGVMGRLRPGKIQIEVWDAEGGLAEFDLVLSSSGDVVSTGPAAVWDGEVLNVTLQTGAGLEGRVVDGDGSPVASGGITVDNNRSINFSGGTYQLRGLTPGVVQVLAYADGFTQLQTAVTVREGIQVLDLVLEEGYPVSGVVLGSEGQAVAGALVTANNSGAQHVSTWARTATDQTGRFRFDEQLKGTLTFSAQADGHAPKATGPIEVAEPVENIEIRLAQGARVFGLVSGLPENALSGLRVVTIGWVGGGSPLVAEVGFDGSYELSNVAPGMIRLMLDHRQRVGLSSRTKTVNVPPSGDVEVNFEFGDVRISGQVLLNGAPGGSLAVSAMSQISRSEGYAQTDPDGRFELDGVSAGPVRLAVLSQDTLLHTETIEVAGDQDILIEIESLPVVGRVIDEEGEGIAGANVVMISGEASDTYALAAASAQTDADGNFSLLVRLPATGRYSVQATLQGYSRANTSWVADDGAPLQLVMASGVKLRLRWSGRAPENGFMALVDSSGAVVQSGGGSLGWTIEDVPVGRFTLYVVSGLVQVVRPVTVLAEPEGGFNSFDVTYPETGRLHLTSSKPGEVGPHGVLSLRLIDAGGTIVRWPMRLMLRDRTQTMLSATTQEIPAGVWTVEISSMDELITSEVVDVRPGSVVEISID